MRALLYASFLAAWALVLQGCLGAPSKADWLAVGFRTPEQTLRTFQTGLRAELPDLEYRCLSGALKRQAGISQLTYREFRDELFHQKPWLKHAARAHVVERIELGPDRCRIVARVRTLLREDTFSVDFVREEYFELWSRGERASDDELPWREMAVARAGSLSVTVPLPANLPAETIDELRAGREWKIDGFPLSDPLSDPPDP